MKRIDYDAKPNADRKAHVGEVWACFDARLRFRVVAERVERGAPVIDIEWLGSGIRDVVTAWLNQPSSFFWRLLYREIESVTLYFSGGPHDGERKVVDGQAPLGYAFPVAQPAGISHYVVLGEEEVLPVEYTVAEYRQWHHAQESADVAFMRFTGLR